VYLGRNIINLEELFNEPFQNIINSLNKKIYTQNLEWSLKYFKLFKLTSNERILLLISNYLSALGLIPEEKALEIFGKDNRDKLFQNTLKDFYNDIYLEFLKDILHYY